MKSEKIVAWLTFFMVAALLFGGLWMVRNAAKQVEPAIGIQASNTAGTIMVETIALTTPTITYTNGSSEVEGYTHITTTNRIYGELLEVIIDYTASISATTDITLTHVGLVNEVVLIKADNATDGVFAPRRLAVLNSGGSSTYEHVPFMLQGTFLIRVGQTTPGSAPGTLYIKYRR